MLQSNLDSMVVGIYEKNGGGLMGGTCINMQYCSQ